LFVQKYGIRHEMLIVAASTFPWAFELRPSYGTVWRKSGFSDSALIVMASSLGQEFSDCLGPYLDLVASIGAPIATATERAPSDLYTSPVSGGPYPLERREGTFGVGFFTHSSDSCLPSN
jgi:hypothetical protein